MMTMIMGEATGGIADVCSGIVVASTGVGSLKITALGVIVLLFSLLSCAYSNT
jgi:hypothetical protein